MQADLTWLIGQQLTKVEKQGYSWFFRFGDDGSVGTESTWRLITADGIAATSEDHGHQFGLPAPLDACAVPQEKIGNRPVQQIDVNPKSGDLRLDFGESVTLELLQLSCDYESWRAIHGDRQVICLGGGGLSG